MKTPTTHELPALVYGLKGIMDLFGVKKSTAQNYKNTWLKPAVHQVGKKIIVNVPEALDLFMKEASRNDRKKPHPKAMPKIS